MKKKIDNEKEKRLMKNILKLENNNLKTKKFTISRMSDEIIKMIKEEVRKCY